LLADSNLETDVLSHKLYEAKNPTSSIQSTIDTLLFCV
jgi:hypothetical protein